MSRLVLLVVCVALSLYSATAKRKKFSTEEHSLDDDDEYHHFDHDHAFEWDNDDDLQPKPFSKTPKDTLDPYVEVGHKTFFVNTYYETNWYNASIYCTKHNMQLATIASKTENEAITEHLNRNCIKGELWVYGTDLSHEKRNEAANAAHFSWMSTGEPIAYSNWGPGEPNHALNSHEEVEHCLVTSYNGKWNDNACNTDSNYFICQSPNQQQISI